MSQLLNEPNDGEQIPNSDQLASAESRVESLLLAAAEPQSGQHPVQGGVIQVDGVGTQKT